jgi:hypothetical protein
MGIQISDEERQRRRERANALVAEGKIGGPRPGSGRPRKKRASEIIAEQVEKRAQQISGALFDGLHKDQPQHIRHDAAAKLLAIEQKEHELTIEEERELRSASRAELIEGLFERLERLQRAGMGPGGAQGSSELGVIEGRAHRALPNGDVAGEVPEPSGT